MLTKIRWWLVRFPSPLPFTFLKRNGSTYLSADLDYRLAEFLDYGQLSLRWSHRLEYLCELCGTFFAEQRLRCCALTAGLESPALMRL